MGYNVYMTKAGYALQAKLFAEGGDLEITRVEVGSGILPEGTDWRSITALVQSRAVATSTSPIRRDCTVSLEIEYRSDLNSGAEEPFQINEFGVFAIGAEGEEALILYGDLSDCPDTAVPPQYGGCVRRYPVLMEIGPYAGAKLDYPAGAWTTHEELSDALTTKQPTLTGAPGQVVGFDGMGLAYAIRGWSNRNLLDNWYFVDPINQQGKSQYNGPFKTYGIDRWYTSNTSVTIEVADGYVHYSRSNGDGQLRQELEDGYLLAGRTVTVSVLVEVESGTLQLSIVDKGPSDSEERYFANAYSTGTGMQLLTVSGTIRDEIDKSGSIHYPVVAFTGNAEAKIFVGKLELGPIQTLAHQDKDGNWVLNDPPPNKALELAKCQRHYWASGSCYYNMDVCPDDYLRLFVPFPQTMRANPSVISYKVATNAGTEVSVEVSGTSQNAVWFVAPPLKTKVHLGISQIIVDANL